MGEGGGGGGVCGGGRETRNDKCPGKDRARAHESELSSDEKVSGTLEV